jgi:hypothetical protein
MKAQTETLRYEKFLFCLAFFVGAVGSERQQPNAARRFSLKVNL